MTPKDRQILENLEGSGPLVASVQLFLMKRGGHILLALSADRAVALETLGLYQPQSLKAKTLVMLIKAAIRLGLHRKFCSETVSVRSSSPLLSLTEDLAHFGFLLGNPESDARRAIAVSESDGRWQVAKIGMNQGSRETVLEELKIINSLPTDATGVPEVVSEGESGDWAYYSTDLVKGCSPNPSDDEMVVAVLHSWLDRAQVINYSATEPAQAIAKIHDDEDKYGLVDKLAEIGDLQVKSGVSHGDYAPWNIKIDSEKGVHVLDWEYGSSQGFAIWDWLHYVVQRSELVGKMAAPAVLSECRKWLFSENGKALIQKAGWADHEELCLGAYLFYTGKVNGFDRDALLKCWNESTVEKQEIS